MKDLHKNVILDLMPLYLSGEASDETKELIEQAASQDSDLKRVLDSESDSLHFTEKTLSAPEE